jgi:hypothetical protein
MQYLLMRLTIIVVMIVGLLGAIFTGSQMSTGNVMVPLLVLCVFLALFLWFGARNWLLSFMIASIFLRGQFNFLPAGLKLFEVLMGFIILHYIIENVIFRKQAVNPGPQIDLCVLLIIVAILVYHGSTDRFGMRVFGSNTWGGRGYFTVFLAIVAYFIIMTLPYQNSLLRWLPTCVVLAQMFDVVVDVVSAQSAGAASFIFRFYSGISYLALREDVTGRFGSFGNFGIYLSMAILAHYSLRSLWRPSYWAISFFYVMSAASVVFSGFRSALANFLFVNLAAAIRDYRSFSFFLILGGAVLVGTMPFVHENIIELPKQAQRALCFMPGKWDPNMVQDANGSNEFRLGVATVWYKLYFPKQMWLGRGFGFDAKDFGTIMMQINTAGTDRETGYEGFVVTQELHNGFLSVIDTIGLLGAFAFIPWCVWILIRVVLTLLRADVEQQPPALRWVCLFLFMWIVSYGFGALKFEDFAPITIICTGLLNALRNRNWSEPEPAAEPAVAAPADEKPLPAAT